MSTKEFDCAECGRHIVDIVGSSTVNLCAHCLFMPQWFTDPELRRIFDPSHPGTEAMERTSE